MTCWRTVWIADRVVTRTCERKCTGTPIALSLDMPKAPRKQTRAQKREILMRAQLAHYEGRTDEARELFASQGISYGAPVYAEGN